MIIFCLGIISILTGIQLNYLAKFLGVNNLASGLLICFGIILCVGAFISSVLKTSKKPEI